MASVLYLIRHATPDWNRKDIRYDVPPGPPLIEQGEIEARQLGEFLKTTGIKHFYASPLERAARTAQIAAEVLGLQVDTMHDIAEWVQGEQEESVLTRCRASLHIAFDESEKRGPLGLVSHGGPIRLLLADLGADPAEIEHYRRIFDNQNPIPPAGAWRVERFADGRVAIPELVFSPRPYARYVPVTVQV